jgi:HD superfamily phosphohydrolase YqeK
MLPYNKNPNKHELVEIMTRYSLDNEDEFVQEIVRDFYKTHSEDELLEFWANCGLKEQELEKEWEFKAQQGPL